MLYTFCARFAEDLSPVNLFFFFTESVTVKWALQFLWLPRHIKFEEIQGPTQTELLYFVYFTDNSGPDHFRKLCLARFSQAATAVSGKSLCVGIATLAFGNETVMVVSLGQGQNCTIVKPD